MEVVACGELQTIDQAPESVLDRLEFEEQSRKTGALCEKSMSPSPIEKLWRVALAKPSTIEPV